jgi:hypothetical protein
MKAIKAEQQKLKKEILANRRKEPEVETRVIKFGLEEQRAKYMQKKLQPKDPNAVSNFKEFYFPEFN